MTIGEAAWVVGVIGLAMLSGGVYASWNAWFAYASRHWPSVPGRFQLAGVYGAPGTPPVYAPTIHYEYEVSGTRYESARLRFGGVSPFSFTMASSEITALTSKAGRPLVYYDPHNPKRACLFAGANEWTLIVPAVLLIVGAALCWLVLWSHRA